jgi:integrase/recombinase XerD
MQVRSYSPTTLHIRRYLLRAFCDWCGEAGVPLTIQISKSDIQRYQTYLYNYRKPGSRTGEQGQPLTISGQQMRLSAVRVFLAWLTKTGVIPTNPALEIEMPREEHRLPRQVLTAIEIEAIFRKINVNSFTGLRDRAILETLYSTGIRRSELIALNTADLNRADGLLRINHGKGARDRVVPISRRAGDWIEKYLTTIRTQWCRRATGDRLFITSRGTPLSGNQLSQIARKRIAKAELGKSGSCHMFRHTCATVLLQNGADLRSIQQLLGHASLETTQLYTQVTVSDLKRVYERCHPAAQQPVAV